MGASGIGLAVLIDDNDIDLFVQKRFVEINHFAKSVITFRSPIDALRYLETAAELPEVILLDLNMPVMDGFEFLEKFQHLPEQVVSYCKVVVLTSSSSASDRDRAISFPSVIAFVSKPMNGGNLEEILLHFSADQPKVPSLNPESH